jgi:type I restriction enzyme R subunit
MIYTYQALRLFSTPLFQCHWTITRCTLPNIAPQEQIETVFQNFWNQERIDAIGQLCQAENLKAEIVQQMIADYKFSGKEPLRETVLSACNEKPKLLERKKVFDRVVSKLLDIVNKFDDAIGDLEEGE